jgi:catechol 2,3-dioxygenase-like lactoylglutathione lyase family enzyme
VAKYGNQGLDHVAIGVSDVERSARFYADVLGFDRAREELAELRLEPRFSDHGIAHSVYFDDPDGHQLELTTYDV